MKQGTTALVATAIVLAGATGVAAQVLPPVSGPPVHYDTRAYYGGRVAPPPPYYAPDDESMPSYEVAAILRSRGFLPLGGPTRRGGYYVVAAVHPRGEEVRVVIDAYTGRVVRFVPASEISGSRGGDEMVLVYQGPTFPPPDAARHAPPPVVAARHAPPPVVAARPVAPPSYGLRSGPPPSTMRGAPRPPASVPQVASRTPPSAPLVTPKPRPQSAPQKPETAQAPPVPAPVETKPAAASPPLVPKPVEKTPPVVQPTQPLPPVQTME
jgi:hypothetical protein